MTADDLRWDRSPGPCEAAQDARARRAAAALVAALTIETDDGALLDVIERLAFELGEARAEVEAVRAALHAAVAVGYRRECELQRVRARLYALLDERRERAR